jgi:NADH-quinone oxidoreductase subunit L
VVVGIGAAGAFLLYGKEYRTRDPLVSLGPVHTALERRLYVDEAYLRYVVRPVQYGLASFVDWTNRVILDGAVNGAAALTRGISGVVRWFDLTVIDGIVNSVGRGAGETGGLLRYLQSGNVQRYAVFLFVGVVALAVVATRV